jgi:hypothetical protein
LTHHSPVLERKNEKEEKNLEVLLCARLWERERERDLNKTVMEMEPNQN